MEQSIRLRRNKLKSIRLMACAVVVMVASIAVGMYAYQQFKPVQAAVNLTFSVAGVHPEASVQSTTSGKTIRDLGVIDGEIFMGYGDYGANTGPIHINPFNIANDAFEGSQLSVLTDAIHVYRTVNGKMYAPMADPRMPWTADVGYAERENDGTWSTKLNAPAIHIFDVATLDGDDMWMVGSSVEEDGSTRRGGTAYRSTDGGTTWDIVMTDGSTPYNPDGLERYYWIAELDGSVYMQARSVSPAAPVRSFDGTTWGSGTTTQVCNTAHAQQVVVFADHIVCRGVGGLPGNINVFDGTNISTVNIPTTDGTIVKDFYVEDEYLYVLGYDWIVRTTDLEDWERVSTTPNTAWSIAVVDDYVYLGDNEGRLLRSDFTITEALTTEFTPNPEKCFAFDPGTGTITNYYDHQDNHVDNPACSRDVVIPSTIDGVAVSSIGASAFYNKQLTSVVVSNSVTEIGPMAFYSNQLTSATIPDSVTTIGSSAFGSNQLTSVAIPDSVTAIGDYVFFSNQLTSITIPDSVTAIGNYAFGGNQLTSVTIPDSVTTIGDAAFYYNQLTSITIPDSVTSIGEMAFAMNSITDVTVVGELDSVGYSVFMYNSVETFSYNGTVYPMTTSHIEEVCINFDGGTILGYGSGQIADILTPLVENGVFCGKLTGDITIPATIGGEVVTAIDGEGFLFNDIDSVYLPDSVTSVSSTAFAGQGLDPFMIDMDFSGAKYVRLYTNNSNIANSAATFSDCVEYEDEDPWGCIEYDDFNYGGHIVNPSTLTINYQSSTGDTIASSQTYTGKVGDDYLSGYLAVNGPTIPAPADPDNPTPEEQQAISDVLASAYFMMGDDITIDPIDIDGYTTPEARSFALTDADNEGTYVYVVNSNSGGDDSDGNQNGGGNSDGSDGRGGLADTGFNSTLVATIGLIVLAVGVAMSLIAVRARRRS